MRQNVDSVDGMDSVETKTPVISNGEILGVVSFSDLVVKGMKK